MSDIDKVTGSACLDFIDRGIGFCDRTMFYGNTYDNNYLGFYARGISEGGRHEVVCDPTYVSTNMIVWEHNKNVRKVGLVLDECDDGGYIVAILSDDSIDYQKYKIGGVQTSCNNGAEYTSNILTNKWTFDEDSYRPVPIYDSDCRSIRWNPSELIPYDDTIDYTPTFTDEKPEGSYPFRANFSFNGTDNPYLYNYQLTKNKDTTLTFGIKREGLFYIWEFLRYNPIIGCRGDLFQLAFEMRSIGRGLMPLSFDTETDLNNYIAFPIGEQCTTHSFVSVPFNIILTHNEQQALEYLDNGTLPEDAFLFPMDWEDLPSFYIDEPEDVPSSNTPDDNDRDITPNPPVKPSYTPAMLSNYNWYWLSVGDYADFIRWFWNDIGAYNDFESLINKVMGLYNNVASAVLLCRYYPVKYEWITGIEIENAPRENIKVGMLERNSLVDVIDQTHVPDVRFIGKIEISKKYNSFIDLAPYSQLSVYLPFHGFIDLDMNIFNGHELYVYGIYDYLNGTIQYLLYYDDEFLVNTVVAKMAIDIPITLQSKNDRDSAVFQNVSSTVAGLIGAGVGLTSGNPIGMALGVTQGVGAISSANACAPLNVKGTVGETGALYSPPQCAIIIRRPTIQASDVYDNIEGSPRLKDGLTTWRQTTGQLCGYGYVLSSLAGAGFTTCHNPRINFTNTAPLQSEVDEIYNYLEKGVIL